MRLNRENSFNKLKILLWEVKHIVQFWDINIDTPARVHDRWIVTLANTETVNLQMLRQIVVVVRIVS